MATRQDELRRLMKESKAQTNKRAPAAKRTGGGATSSAAALATSDGKNVHAKSNGSASADVAGKAIPAGFFDDSLADAKARNVDLKHLAETQLNQDWEQFQEFVAELEQQDVKDSELQKEEVKEKEAVEQLENMQYVDRYRIALERSAKLGAAKKKGSKKRGPAPEEEKKPEATATDSTANGGAGAGAGDADVDEEHAVANAVQNHMKKLKTTKQQKQKKTESSDGEEEAFDPCNWRSKAL